MPPGLRKCFARSRYCFIHPKKWKPHFRSSNVPRQFCQNSPTTNTMFKSKIRHHPALETLLQDHAIQLFAHKSEHTPALQNAPVKATHTTHYAGTTRTFMSLSALCASNVHRTASFLGSERQLADGAPVFWRLVSLLPGKNFP